MKQKMFRSLLLSLLALSLFLATPTTISAAPKLLNLNTATLKELVKLPGIGKQTAKRILIYRTQSGPIASLKDLEKVKGLGKRIIAKLSKLTEVNKNDKVNKLDEGRLAKYIADTTKKRKKAKKAKSKKLCKQCATMVKHCKACKKIGKICKKCAIKIGKCKACKKLAIKMKKGKTKQKALGKIKKVLKSNIKQKGKYVK